MMVDWVNSTRESQAQIAQHVVKKFVASGGYDELIAEAKTAQKRSVAELSAFTLTCMNKMGLPPGDPGINDIKIPIGDLMSACIETSLYN
jgi:hypothetical protein